MEPVNLKPDECIAKAGFDCLVPTRNIDRLYSEDVQNICEDIINLRKLDSWHSWREELLSYKLMLNEVNNFTEVQAITNELVGVSFFL